MSDPVPKSLTSTKLLFYFEVNNSIKKKKKVLNLSSYKEMFGMRRGWFWVIAHCVLMNYSLYLCS